MKLSGRIRSLGLMNYFSSTENRAKMKKKFQDQTWIIKFNYQ